MSAAELHVLSGAYAAGALPSAEAAFFERHLDDCGACMREVEEFTATTAVLGLAVAEEPPPGLRGRVLAAVDVTRQVPPRSRAGDARAPTVRRLRRLLPAVAAVLTVAAVALGVVTAQLDGGLGTPETPRVVTAGAADELFDVLTAPDTRTVPMDAEGASSARFVYSASLDRGVLVAAQLPGLIEEGVYELWLFHDGAPHSGGVFEPGSAGDVITSVEGLVAGAELVAVTAEPRGGQSQPEGPVVMSAEPEGR